MKFKRGLIIDKGWIDFVPFLNIVILFNLFFILMSSMAFQPGVKVNIPFAGAVDVEREKDISIVTISKDNRVFLNERWVAFPLLKKAMKALSDNNPDKLVIIKADSNVLHDKVVEVMNIIIESGIKRISIAAKPKPVNSGQ